MVACGMIVALMASLGSKFNASATLFTMDFYREWHPNASGKTEVIVGRIATAAIVFRRHLLGAGDQGSAHEPLPLSPERAGLSLARHRGAVRHGRVLETRHCAGGLVGLHRRHVGRLSPSWPPTSSCATMPNDDQTRRIRSLPRRRSRLDQYNAGIAPIKAKIRPAVRFLEHSLAGITAKFCSSSPPW